MNFSSEKTATVDEKGRVVLPAEFKQEMGGKIFEGQLVVEQDPYVKCLNIYPVDAWEKHFSFLKKHLNRNSREQSRLLDLIYRSFKRVSVPESGRINLPNTFMERVNIVKEVVFVGQGDRIRLWGQEEYDTYFGKTEEYSDLYRKYFGDINEEDQE